MNSSVVLGCCDIRVLQMYSFTSFAMQLNELHTEMEASLPRTDCRLRPDIRAMENGDIGNAPAAGGEPKEPRPLRLTSEAPRCLCSNRRRQ